MFGRVVAHAVYTWNEYHRRGANSRHHLSIVTRTGSHSTNPLAQRSRTHFNRSHDFRVEGHRQSTRQLLLLDRNPFLDREGIQIIDEMLLRLFQLMLVRIPQINSKDGFARHDIDEARLQMDAAYCCQLLTTHAQGQLTHEAYYFHCSVRGVPPRR